MTAEPSRLAVKSVISDYLSAHRATQTRLSFLECHQKYESSHEADVISSLIPKCVERFVETYHIADCVRRREEKQQGIEGEKLVYAQMAPMSCPMKTVVIFADISGFTKMTKALTTRGLIGAEEVVKTLNEYLEPIIKEIISSGGDIMKFVGDAIIAIWPPDDLNEDLSVQEQTLRTKAHRAVNCAMKIQETWPKRKGGLMIKFGIGCGDGVILHVGGCMGRIEALGVGPAFMQAFNCESECIAGDVVISEQVYDKLGDIVEVQNPNGGKSRFGNKLVSKCEGKAKRSLRYKANGMVQELKSQDLIERLGCYVPMLPQFKQRWSAELRRTSCLFINFQFELANIAAHETPHETTENIITRLHNVIRTIQECVYTYKGSLNKFLFDDKGATVLAFYGLRPNANANDCQRAVLAGLELIDRVPNEHGIDIWVGITTGKLFTGRIGSPKTRWEFTAIGNQVNLSARLAGIAHKNKNIPNLLCDSSIYHECCYDLPRVILRKEDDFDLKGYATKVTVYSISRNHSFEEPAIVSAKYDTRMHIGQVENDNGRDDVRKLIEKIKAPDSLSVSKEKGKIAKNKRSRHLREKGDVFLVEGKPGCGKTEFIRVISGRFKKDAIFAWGRGDPLRCGQRRKMVVWEQILNKLYEKFPKEGDSFIKTLSRYVEKRRPRIHHMLFIVNDIFFHDNPYPVDNDRLMQMSDAEICCVRYDLIFLFVEMVAVKKAVVIVVDQIKDISKEDWYMTVWLCNLIRRGVVYNIAVIIGARPLLSDCYKPRHSIELIAQYSKLRENADQIFTPSCLETEKMTNTFLVKFLRVHEVSKMLAKVVHQRCGGYPGLIVAFMKRLKANDNSFKPKLIVVPVGLERGGTRAQFEEDVEKKLEANEDVLVDTPSSIFNSTTQLLDNLQPPEYFIMKTAAVICIGQSNRSMTFSRNCLRDIHPIKEYLEFLKTSLVVLCKWGLLKSVSKPEELLADETPMPSVASLIQQPKVRRDNYKYGVLLKKNIAPKKGGKFAKRFFVYKNQTLYWFANESDMYPRNSVRFGPEVLGIEKYTKNNKEVIIFETKRKTWQLKADKHNDELDSWYKFLVKQWKDSRSNSWAAYHRKTDEYYQFAYGFLRDVVYATMLYSQRVDLHQACIKYYAKMREESDDSRWAILELSNKKKANACLFTY